MKKLAIVFCILSGLLLGSFEASAQNNPQLEAQADEWAKKSFTHTKALSAYLSCLKEEKDKKGIVRLTDKTTQILKGKKMIFDKDVAVVDSIIDEIRLSLGKDCQHFLPLLELRIQKSSNYANKYLQEFQLFEEAVELRSANNLQKGMEYEQLLRWYVDKLIYKKDLSESDKLKVYADLWHVYRINTPELDSLDVKLLDKYASQCYYSKDYQTQTNLLELKKQFIEKTNGKECEDYLDILERLSLAYYNLYQSKYPKGLYEMKPEKEKEISYEKELIRLNASMEKDVKISDIKSLLFDLTYFQKDTVEICQVAAECASLVGQRYGKESAAYCEAFGLMVQKNMEYNIKDTLGISQLVTEYASLVGQIYGKTSTTYCETFGMVVQTNMKYIQKDTLGVRRLVTEYTSLVEQIHGKENPIYCEALNQLVNTYEMFDADAIPILRELLSLQEKVYGKEHFSYQATLTHLNDYLSQNHHMQEAISMRSSNISNTDVSGLMSLSLDQRQYGLYREAVETYGKMMECCASSPQIKGNYIVTTVLGVVNCYQKLKDLDGLLAFGKKWSSDNRFGSEEQKYIFSNVLSTASLLDKANEKVLKFIDDYLLSHPLAVSSAIGRAEILEHKATTYLGMKLFEKSEDIIRQILVSLRQEKADTRIILKYEQYLEICLWINEQWDEALEQNRKVLSMLTQFPGYKNFLEYLSLCCRAVYYYDRKDNFDEVLKLCAEIDNFDPLQSASISMGTTFNFSTFSVMTVSLDRMYVETQYYRALCHKDMKKEAEDMIKKDVEEKMSLVKFTLNQMDKESSQNTMLWTKQVNDNLCNVAVLSGGDSLAIKAFNYTLLYKQSFLTAENLMNKQLLDSDNESIKEKFHELQNLRTTVRQYETNGLPAEELKERIVQLEKQLVEDSKMYGDFTNGLNMTWDRIQKRLKQEDVAIEFLSYLSYKDHKEHLAALVLRSDWNAPKIIELFSVEQIPENIYDNIQFSQLCWGSIYKYLDGIKNVYFAPAGVLYNIGLESLLAPDGEGYMSERYCLYRVSSTRELAMRSDWSQHNKRNAVIYGGIDYQAAAGLSEDDETKVTDNKSGNMEFLRDLRGAMQGIDYLPGSKIEAENILQILKGKNDSSKIQLFTGSEGTESSFKSISGKDFGIVHVSTHGFYNTVSDDVSHISGFYQQQDNEDKVLTRSGLLFAGAENTLLCDSLPDSYDDGILTAFEISTLDLRTLDLVTLSACQTAQGDITGDGVFGLQRGFKKAGANSILMSLWKVDDAATCLLMTEFYRNWMNGKSKHDALESAKKVVRSHKDKGWDNPKYWAAFILLDGLD